MGLRWYQICEWKNCRKAYMGFVLSKIASAYLKICDKHRKVIKDNGGFRLKDFKTG